MKKRIKKYGIMMIIIVFFLIGTLWYYRPLSAFQMQSAVTEESIKSVHVLIYHYRADGSEEDARVIDINEEEPSMVRLLEQVNQLHFRRPPTNLLQQFLPNTVYGKGAQPNTYHFLIIFSGDESFELQFFIDAWSYSYSGLNMFLPCTEKSPPLTGNELGQFLWELSERSES